MEKLYNRFRPQDWNSLVDQEELVVTLCKQVKDNTPSHTYLFIGTRGTGKTTSARILGRALNCLNPQDGSPCGECEACKSESLDIYELDAASNNGVGDVRELINKTIYQPQHKYKVFIIDEVHMLSTGAFNALLKTLEEPPAYCIFILCTTEERKVPATVRSRCSKFHLNRISTNGIVNYMKYVLDTEKRSYEENGLKLIAANSDGAMRDALSILEQVGFYSEVITEDAVATCIGCSNINEIVSFVNAILSREIKESLLLLSELLKRGKDVNILISSVQEVIRDCMMVKNSPEFTLDNTKEYCLTIKQLASAYSLENIIYSLDRVNKILQNIKYSVNPVVVLQSELALYCFDIQDNKESEILSLKAVVEQLEIKLNKLLCERVPSYSSQIVSRLPKAKTEANMAVTCACEEIETQEDINGKEEEEIEISSDNFENAKLIDLLKGAIDTPGCTEQIPSIANALGYIIKEAISNGDIMLKNIDKSLTDYLQTLALSSQDIENVLSSIRNGVEFSFQSNNMEVINSSSQSFGMDQLPQLKLENLKATDVVFASFMNNAKLDWFYTDKVIIYMMLPLIIGFKQLYDETFIMNMLGVKMEVQDIKLYCADSPF